MRVIAGKYKGHKLYSLTGVNTRPTLDRVKETLFNIIQNDIKGANVLDLFAGTGALGIEAISRGAEFSTFVDNNKNSINIINKNIEKVKAFDKVKVINTNYKDAIIKFKQEKSSFDIIFLDPPYNKNILKDLLESIKSLEILNDNGIIVIEHELELKLDIKNYTLIKDKKLGNSKLLFLKI